MANLIDTGDMSPELLKNAHALVSAIELANVRMTSFGASLSDEPAGRPVRADVSSTTAFAASKGVFANKFQWEVHLLDEHEAPVGEMHATFVLEYSVPDDFELDAKAADHVTSSTGLMAAFPYAREFFQSASARLQLDPVVLGLLRLSDMAPRGVTMVSSAREPEASQLNRVNERELQPSDAQI